MSEHGDGVEPEGRLLDAAETALWREFLSWSDTVAAQVEQAVATATGLSAAEFGVLIRVQEIGGTMPQKRLQDELGWTATRLSHQLARMERRGYIDRRGTGTGRAVAVHVTGLGLDALRGAKAPHAAAVRQYFLDARPEHFGG